MNIGELTSLYYHDKSKIAGVVSRYYIFRKVNRHLASKNFFIFQHVLLILQCLSILFPHNHRGQLDWNPDQLNNLWKFFELATQPTITIGLAGVKTDEVLDVILGLVIIAITVRSYTLYILYNVDPSELIRFFHELPGK